MLKIIHQEARHFEKLSAMQFGWQADFLQIGPAVQTSKVMLMRTDNVGICHFQFNTCFDQRVHVKPDYYSFGLLEADTSRALVQGKLAPAGSLIVFPREEEAHGTSRNGFHGNGIHFKNTYLEAIAEKVFKTSLRSLVPGAKIYRLNEELLRNLQGEIYKWRHAAELHRPMDASIIASREEELAIAVLNGLSYSTEISKTPFFKSEKIIKRALDYVHSAPADEISAVELCTLTGCSQRWLEHCFKQRLGVTPKRYIKFLRLARLRQDLVRAKQAENPTVIETAIAHGFWHMGQLAADYRRVYGELPSKTLKRANPSPGFCN